MQYQSALIVDDSRFMRKIIADSMKDIGITKVFFAQNCTDAKKLYSENHPDLVTLDLVMPGKSGIDCLEELLEIDNNAIVIMISTLANQNLVNEALRKGAKGYLQKPFTTNSILQIITNLVVN